MRLGGDVRARLLQLRSLEVWRGSNIVGTLDQWLPNNVRLDSAFLPHLKCASSDGTNFNLKILDFHFVVLRNGHDAVAWDELPTLLVIRERLRADDHGSSLIGIPSARVNDDLLIVQANVLNEGG